MNKLNSQIKKLRKMYIKTNMEENKDKSGNQ